MLQERCVRRLVLCVRRGILLHIWLHSPILWTRVRGSDEHTYFCSDQCANLHANLHAYDRPHRGSYQCTDGRPIVHPDRHSYCSTDFRTDCRAYERAIRFPVRLPHTLPYRRTYRYTDCCTYCCAYRRAYQRTDCCSYCRSDSCSDADLLQRRSSERLGDRHRLWWLCMRCLHFGSAVSGGRRLPEQHLPWRRHMRHAHADTIADLCADCGADCCTHRLADSRTDGSPDGRPDGLAYDSTYGGANSCTDSCSHSCSHGCSHREPNTCSHGFSYYLANSYSNA